MAVVGLPVSLFPSPPPLYIMPPIRDLVGALAEIARNRRNSEKHLRRQGLEENAAIPDYKKSEGGETGANQRLFNDKRKVRDPTFVADVTAKVASNRYVTIRKLAQTHGILTKIIHATLHGDLILPKNCAR